MHSFLAEVMAICRAHVSGLGGNALVAYTVSECELDDNLHKNQVQTWLTELYPLHLGNMILPNVIITSLTEDSPLCYY